MKLLWVTHLSPHDDIYDIDPLLNKKVTTGISDIAVWSLNIFDLCCLFYKPLKVFYKWVPVALCTKMHTHECRWPHSYSCRGFDAIPVIDKNKKNKHKKCIQSSRTPPPRSLWPHLGAAHPLYIKVWLAGGRSLSIRDVFKETAASERHTDLEDYACNVCHGLSHISKCVDDVATASTVTFQPSQKPWIRWCWEPLGSASYNHRNVRKGIHTTTTTTTRCRL